MPSYRVEFMKPGSGKLYSAEVVAKNGAAAKRAIEKRFGAAAISAKDKNPLSGGGSKRG